MYKDKKYIFNSSGWQVSDDLQKKTNSIITSLRKKRDDKKISIFSIIDSDIDLEEIIHNAKFFTDQKLKNFVLIGTGGSSLGADSFIRAHKYHHGDQSIGFHILDNLDPNAVSQIFDVIEPSTAKFLAVSKSGKTTETIALLLIVINWLISKNIKVKESIMVMCEEKSNEFQELIEIAKEYNLKIVQHQKIGGRFSALTSTGLLPAAVMGLDPYMIRKSARDSLNNVFDNNNFIIKSALFSNNLNEQSNLNCVISYGDALSPLVAWYKQLWNESLGKDSKGTFLLSGKGSLDQHSQLQMWLDGPNIGNYTFLKVNNNNGHKIPKSEISPWLSGLSLGEILNTMAESTYDALKENRRAVRSISIPDISSETIASLMVTFILEVLVVAELLGVDPYTQNAVEAIKINTFKRLKNYEYNKKTT
jgi:glucose-6-phosphate isomerase